MSNPNTEAQTVADLVQKPFVHTENSASPVVFLPLGNGQWGTASLEQFQTKPDRKKGSVALHDVDSFIEIAKRHGTVDGSIVYIDADYTNNKVQAVAVFNDHAGINGESGWRDHRAAFTPRQNKAWQEWIANNNKAMTQVELANFFEQNLKDFASADGKPSGAQVLEFVLCLQETRTVRYGSAVNIQNGMVRLEFIEDNDKATKGQLEIFKEFALGLAPFFGGGAYQTNAFLRYRIDRSNGQITFWYELQKPEKILESACAEIIKRIKETKLPVVFGVPDSRG